VDLALTGEPRPAGDLVASRRCHQNAASDLLAAVSPGGTHPSSHCRANEHNGEDDIPKTLHPPPPSCPLYAPSSSTMRTLMATPLGRGRAWAILLFRDAKVQYLPFSDLPPRADIAIGPLRVLHPDATAGKSRLRQQFR